MDVEWSGLHRPPARKLDFRPPSVPVIPSRYLRVTAHLAPGWHVQPGVFLFGASYAPRAGGCHVQPGLFVSGRLSADLALGVGLLDALMAAL